MVRQHRFVEQEMKEMKEMNEIGGSVRRERR